MGQDAPTAPVDPPPPVEVPAVESPAPVTPAPVAPKPKPKPKPLFRPTAPTADGAWIATLHKRVVVRGAPKPRASVRMRLSPIAPFAGGVVRLLVTNSIVRDGEVWVQVLLPRRPNGSTGWIRLDDASVRKSRVRVVIDVGDRTLTAFRGRQRLFTVTVALGKAGTPTPRGRFAIAETVRTNTPGAFLGPIVLPLTGYSETLNEFAGGDGRVAIHGTSAPSLLGTYASNGCIRMRNDAVTRLARLAPPGTPVTITP